MWRVKDWWRVKREKLLISIAWAMPKELVTWCVIRVFSNATTNEYSTTHPDEVNYSVAMQRWEKV